MYHVDGPMPHRQDVTDKQQNTCTHFKEEILKSIPWPNNVPTCKAFVALSKEMKHWECYADKLNISKARQIEIERNHCGDYPEQKFQLLRIWKEQEGREATWKVFISACIDLQDHHLRNKAIALCKSSVALQYYANCL